MAYVIYYALSPLTWFFFAFGLIVGSFLNVCIYRIPEREFFKSSRSFCRACGVSIPMYFNIPVLSYLMLGGKTACCKTKLSIQYPLVELFTGFLFVMVYWQFPFVGQMNGEWRSYDSELIRFIHAIIFSCIMLVCSVIDWRLMIIPDSISLPMIALSPVVAYFHPDLDLKSSLIGVALGGLSLYVIAWAYWLVRREIGLGMGDVKLLAGIGGWLGYQAIIPTIFVGSIVGAAFGIVAIAALKRLTLKSALPFGPFLALGAFLHLVFGTYIREWLFFANR